MPRLGSPLSDAEIERRIRQGEVVRYRVHDRREILPDLPEIFGEAYNKRTSGGAQTTGRECVVCGKQTRRANAKSPVKVLHVRVSQGIEPGLDHQGLHAVRIEASIPEQDDMGCFPVGPTCAAKFPAAYLTELEV